MPIVAPGRIGAPSRPAPSLVRRLVDRPGRRLVRSLGPGQVGRAHLCGPLGPVGGEGLARARAGCGRAGRPRRARRSSRPPGRWPSWRPARRPASARWRAASRGRCRLWERIGTPTTGRIVCPATMPGRWAAPPAPAMTTCSPRPAADVAYSTSRSGVRWADTTRTSWATPKRSSTTAAFRMVSQSLLEPMMTPTAGRGRRPRLPVRPPKPSASLMASLATDPLRDRRAHGWRPARR